MDYKQNEPNNIAERFNQIKPTNDVTLSKQKQQNISDFDGVMLSDKSIKLLYLSSLLGPLGLVFSVYIYTKKTYKNKKETYYYCAISRAKAGRAIVFALVVSVVYVLILMSL